MTNEPAPPRDAMTMTRAEIKAALVKMTSENARQETQRSLDATVRRLTKKYGPKDI